MFKVILQTDYFDKEQKIALDTVIKEDRKKYEPITEMVKKLIQSNEDAILSNPYVISNLTSIQTDLIIYTPHTRKLTTTLSNGIHRKFGKFVQMRSILPHREYNIIYDGRPLIKIYHLARYKKIDIASLFDITMVKNLRYFSLHVELIDVYHKLYLPNFYDEWADLQKLEKKMYAQLKIAQKKPHKSKKKSSECNLCKEMRSASIGEVRKLIIQYLNDENFILVGQWAMFAKNKQIKEKESTFNELIQIVSENSIDVDYKNFALYLSKFTKHKIFFKKRKLYVPKNNRILKHTIYIKYVDVPNASGTDKPIMDIYNCGSYEILPYVKCKTNIGGNVNLNIGCSHVCMYFALINIWMANLVLRVSDANDAIYHKLHKYYEVLKWAHDKLPLYSASYIGINYDEQIEQKITISENQIRKSSYYPEKNLKGHGKYKLIATSS